MNNFIYHNPTETGFRQRTDRQTRQTDPRRQEDHDYLRRRQRAAATGVYDQVVKALEGRDWVEFWGIEPNPSVETLREAIALGK